ncbi:hypothetical protein EC973_005774, partial [Apophysomyces ossiformis]
LLHLPSASLLMLLVTWSRINLTHQPIPTWTPTTLHQWKQHSPIFLMMYLYLMPWTAEILQLSPLKWPIPRISQHGQC